jgi:signal transduction histidine kinase
MIDVNTVVLSMVGLVVTTVLGIMAYLLKESIGRRDEEAREAKRKLAELFTKFDEHRSSTEKKLHDAEVKQVQMQSHIDILRRDVSDRSQLVTRAEFDAKMQSLAEGVEWLRENFTQLMQRSGSRLGGSSGQYGAIRGPGTPGDTR